MKATIPPLPFGSDMNDTLTTSYLKTDSIRTNSFTNHNITIENDRILGITDPVNLQDAVNKQYTDIYATSFGPIFPEAPDRAILFNGIDVFTGANTLKWTTVLVSSATLSDGISLWTGDILTELVPPVLPTDIGTKDYMDNFNNINQYSIDINENTTYTAEQCINSIIRRVSYGSMLVDLLPPAIEWIPLIAGSSDANSNDTPTSPCATSTFSIYHTSENEDARILIVPNIGISIFTSLENGTLQKQLYISLYKNYKLNAKIQVISPTEISVIIENIQFLGPNENNSNSSLFISDQFAIQDKTSYFTNIMIAKEEFTYPFNPVSISTISPTTYDANSILGGYIMRGPNFTTHITDVLDNILLQSKIPYNFQPATVPLSNPSGFQFYIKNLDDTYNITLNTTGWTTDYNYTIEPLKTRMFGISFAKDPSNGYADTSYVYSIGTF